MSVIAKEIVRDTFSPAFGMKLGEVVVESIKGKDYVIDFSGIDTFTSLFFNGMFKIILDNFSKDEMSQILKDIKVENLNSTDNGTYNRSKNTVISNLVDNNEN